VKQVKTISLWVGEHFFSPKYVPSMLVF